MYRPDDNPDHEKTLEQLRSELPKGKWRTSAFFEQVSVAVEQRMPYYSQFSLLEEMDKAILIAFYRAKSTIEEYESHLRIIEMDRPRPKAGR